MFQDRGPFTPVPDEVEEVGAKVLDAAFRVHTHLGPGLLEGLYQECMGIELDMLGLDFEQEAEVPVKYRGIPVDRKLRVDLLVEGCVLVELKSVRKLSYNHSAQILTYLELTGCPLGFLLNFNVPRLKNGFRRFVN